MIINSEVRVKQWQTKKHHGLTDNLTQKLEDARKDLTQRFQREGLLRL